MNFNCARCGLRITSPGALVFSPPIGFETERSTMEVIKMHICQACWPDLVHWLNNGRRAGGTR